MILAEKIITLRKKNGWSQEELAEKVNVSRQSVSKWEGAQAVPDLEKILKLADLFGVTTDYLLKDEMGEEEYAQSAAEENTPMRHVSMEEANAFLKVKEETSKTIAFATSLCVLSPICLLLLGAASESTKFSVSENFAGGVGLTVLLLMVAAAVSMFITSGAKTNIYAYLEEEPFETEYGVTGMVKERQKKFRDTYTKYNVIGTSLCIVSAIPLLCSAFLTQDDFVLASMVCVLLFIIAIAVTFFIRVGICWESMQKLLQEGDYTVQMKKKNPVADAVSTIFWLLTTAIYLGYSFVTDNWERSWIVWPVAGVLFAAVMIVVRIIDSRKNQ